MNSHVHVYEHIFQYCHERNSSCVVADVHGYKDTCATRVVLLMNKHMYLYQCQQVMLVLGMLSLTLLMVRWQMVGCVMW